MPKRKLHGAALAAHQRKMARSGRKSSTALVRRSSGAVAHTRTRTHTIVKVKRVRAGGGAMGVMPLKHKVGIGVAGGAYGYLDNNQNMLTKGIDKLKGHGVPHDFLVAGITHVIALKTKGWIRRGADYLACAAIAVGGYKVGAVKGDFAQVADDVGEMDDVGDDEMDDVGDDEIADNAEYE